jgi:hypothetical protein
MLDDKNDEISILADDYFHKETEIHTNDLNGFRKYLTNVKEVYINIAHSDMFVELESMEKIIESLKDEGIL